MENRRTTLRWTNPSDSDLAEVIVLRKMGEFPDNHMDGDVTYRSTSPAPGDHVEYVDTWVVNGRVYFYAVFSRDSAGNWNDMVEEGKNADTAHPLNPNNKPPKASFEYYPTEPRVGKPIYFDALDSSDEDGWVVLYEWDWDGDGKYDWFTNNAEVTFIYSKSGTYRVGLRVTDNDGATSSMTLEIKVAEWHFWDKLSDEYPGKYVKKLTDEEYQYILNELYIFTLENRDKVAKFSGWLDEEDKEIGEYFSKIPYQTIRDALDVEMDPKGSPGRTYGIHILNALREMKKVELVWTGQYAIASGDFFSYLLETNTKWTTDRTAEELYERSLDILIELIGKEAPTLSVGMSITLLVPDCLEAGIAVAKLAQTLYYNSLRLYLERRYYDGLSHEEAWKEVDPTQEAELQDYHIPIKDPKLLAIISNTFKRLYETYGQHLGSLEAFQKEAKKNLRVLLQNVLKATSPVGHVLVEPHSPVEIRVYDTYGNITGIINGQLYEQIPHSACDDEIGTIVIFSPPSGCYYEVVGQDYGSYGVEIASFENGTIVSFIARDIPTAPGAANQYNINWEILSLEGEGVTVQVDSDSDGIFEYTFTSDSELTRDEFIQQTTPTYTLTVTATVGGITNPSPGMYTYTANSSVQVTAIPDANYLFDHWELDTVNVGSANPYTVLMENNHTLKAVFTYLPPPPSLSASINPLSASILVGQSVTFTSTVSGGYTPYTYQWYLNGNPVSGASASSWTFTPTTGGIYYVYLKVIDAKGNTAQSDTARMVVSTVPVGGYSIPIQLPTTAKPVTLHIALLTIVTAIFVTIKQKTRRKHRQ